jgi:NADH-quinone oxidoreductase subunit J
LPFQRPIAIALSLIVLAEVLLLIGHTWATGAKTASAVPIEGAGAGGEDFGTNIQRVARVLFTDFLWPFQLTALLLVIAVVGSVAVARRSGERATTGSTPGSTAEPEATP